MKLLDRLETLLTLAECNSFTETAKRLYCTQPTITKHVQQLEAYFGATLLIRDGNGIRWTAAGEIALNYSRKTIHLLMEAQEKVRHSVLQHNQICSIYTSQYIASCHLPEILNAYHRKFPNQLLEIHALNYADLRQALLAGQARFALMPLYEEDEQLQEHFTSRQLFEEQLVLVMPADHPWASRKRVAMRELNRQTLLLSQSKYMNQLISQYLQRYNARVQFLQMSNFQIIAQAVKAHLGLSFLPAPVVTEWLARGELAAVPLSSLSLTRSNGLLIPLKSRLTEPEQDFIRETASYFKSRFPKIV
ncbi:LysR family transcriptional regulator [Paenibacillus sanguinis]|uniref:LysR family transcriptional regulator n=1 Tax=Paenibacillus sanguinis TaxID=225906 RepID=UPI00036929A3|nr:LysR family transcriptional regulator [Paenibacillus sanguinis]